MQILVVMLSPSKLLTNYFKFRLEQTNFILVFFFNSPLMLLNCIQNFNSTLTSPHLSRDERPALSVSGLVTGVSEPYLDIDT